MDAIVSDFRNNGSEAGAGYLYWDEGFAVFLAHGVSPVNLTAARIEQVPTYQYAGLQVQLITEDPLSLQALVRIFFMPIEERAARRAELEESFGVLRRRIERLSSHFPDFKARRASVLLKGLDLLEDYALLQ